MAIAVISWLIAIPGLGFATGLRTLTPITVFCWFAWLGYAPVQDTWAFWTAKLPSVIIFTVLAAGEFWGDKLPKTPARILPFPLLARFAFGGLVGSLVATSLRGSVIEGILLGLLGAALGAFGGYVARRVAVDRTGWPDWRVAIIEDTIAVTLSIFAMGIVTG